PEAALSTRTEGLELLIDDLGEQREALDLRMESVRARLTAQFSALDSLISQLDTTSAFLGQQLASLPGNSPTTQS
ncbi:MAG: flagellar hook protein FliD, partial [Pseudomonadota bacterium]